MPFTAVNSSTCLVYCESDKKSGRCRVNRKTFTQLKATLGNVVQVRLNFDTCAPCDVLCTLWPERDDSVDESELCLDPSVVLSGCLPDIWTSCSAEVIQVSPQKSCSSIYIHPLNINMKEFEKMGAAALLGLPIAAGCTAKCAGNRTSMVSISRINGSTFGSVVGPTTILIKQPLQNSSSSSNIASSEIYCAIRVVRELIDRVVRPSIDLPSVVQYKGVMLLGPPGVGKTYAVKAVKHLCGDWCKIHVVELSVPMLLAESDPLQRLEKLFTTLSKLTKARIKKTTGSSSTSGGGVSAGTTPIKTPLTPSTRSSGGIAAMSGSVPSTPLSTSVSGTPLPHGLVTPISAAGANRTPIKYTPATKSSSVSSVAENTASSGFKFKSPSSSNSFLLNKKTTTVTPGSTAAAARGAAAGGKSLLEDQEEGQEGVTVTEFNSSSVYEPELVFLVVDEIDALGKGGGSSSITQNAIKQRICTWLDSINLPVSNTSNGLKPSKVNSAARVRCCMLATSNRAEDIDLCFRRGGRLEQELVVMTTQQDRALLLETLLISTFKAVVGVSDEDDSAGPLNQDELKRLAGVLAERTGGYVAADLVAVVREMRTLSEGPASDVHNAVSIAGVNAASLQQWFDSAVQTVPPSCLRGVSIQVPMISYDDIIGYTSVKKSLQRVLAFSSSPEMRASISRFKLSAPGGVLLHGPPGNSKTRLVMAAASEHGLPVISLTSADIFSPYVGDAEAEIRKAFRVARQARPCVLFIDELDSIVTNRDSEGSGNTASGVEGRILATLLTEMDGIQGDDDRSTVSSTDTTVGEAVVHSNSGGVIVLGATNRLDFIDAALIRKGRFHHVLHVPLPNEEERTLILKHFAKKCKLDETSLDSLLMKLKEGMSGADIENLCREEVLGKLQ